MMPFPAAEPSSMAANDAVCWRLAPASPVVLFVADLPAKPRTSLHLTVAGTRHSGRAVAWTGHSTHGQRLVLLVRLPADSDLSKVALATEDTVLARAGSTQPLAAGRLLEGLRRSDQESLAFRILDEGIRTLKLGSDVPFLTVCRSLLAGVLGPPLRPTRCTQLSQALVHVRLPIAPAEAPILCLGPERARRNRFGAQAGRQAATGSAADVLLDLGEQGETLRIDHLVTRRADGGLVWVDVTGRGGSPMAQLEEDGQAQAEPQIRYLWPRLRSCAADPAVRGLMQEMALFRATTAAPIAPVRYPFAAGMDCAVPTGEGSVFVRGWLADPHDLIKGLDLIDPAGNTHPIDERLFRYGRPDGPAALRLTERDSRPGFITVVRDVPVEPVDGAQYRLRLRFASGSAAEVAAPPTPLSSFEARRTVLEGLAPIDLPERAMPECLAPVVAPLHWRCLDRARVADVRTFGRGPANPRRSIVIPLYKTLNFIRLQATAFAVDPDMAESEVIYVLDSPEQRQQVERELQELSIVYGLAFVLVVMTRNFGYAPAVNAGVGEARGRVLLLVNSDIVPTEPGWQARLDAIGDAHPDAGAIGPRLLFDDDSLQHGGLYFGRDHDGRWLNRHYWKGYPGAYPPALQTRVVPGVTGACVRIARDVYEDVGGLSEEYVIGDYEDSDLCLKLIRTGRSNWYVGDAALYHFERLSISRHEGYERTLVSEYNRWLHTSRWEGLMEDVMGRFEDMDISGALTDG